MTLLGVVLLGRGWPGAPRLLRPVRRRSPARRRPWRRPLLRPAPGRG